MRQSLFLYSFIHFQFQSNRALLWVMADGKWLIVCAVKSITRLCYLSFRGQTWTFSRISDRLVCLGIRKAPPSKSFRVMRWEVSDRLTGSERSSAFTATARVQRIDDMSTGFHWLYSLPHLGVVKFSCERTCKSTAALWSASLQWKYVTNFTNFIALQHKEENAVKPHTAIVLLPSTRYVRAACLSALSLWDGTDLSGESAQQRQGRFQKPLSVQITHLAR